LKMRRFNNPIKLLMMVCTFIFMQGCVATTPPLATPNQLSTLNIQLIDGNSGKYMSPITSDNIPAEWVNKSIDAKIGAGIGSTAGAYVGSQLLGSVPFVGGFLGSQVGEEIGRETAILAAGGDEFIKQSSDLSFNDLESLAIYLYVNYGDNPNYQPVLEATYEIYPDLQQVNYSSLASATARYEKGLAN